MPILAICRGIQELNVALGGSLHQRVHLLDGREDHQGQGATRADHYQPRHRIELCGRFATLFAAPAITVNSVHGQAIDRLAPALEIQATAPDGTIEGVADPSGPLHPRRAVAPGMELRRQPGQHRAVRGLRHRLRRLRHHKDPRMTDHSPALLLGRILASVIFILGGYAKLTAAAATKGYFAQIGVPMPEIAYWVSTVVELGGGLLILLGAQTRLVALILAVFCIATALLGHQFWNAPAPALTATTINFEKNLCMAGGFLAFVAAGAGRYSLDAMRNRTVAVA